MNITIDDFAPLSPLVKGYELDPAKHYLLVADGKKFEYRLAEALFKNIRENHPNLSIHVIATEVPKAVEVRETTLADQIEAIQQNWLNVQSSIVNIPLQDFIAEVSPLLDRAIKALRGDHA